MHTQTVTLVAALVVVTFGGSVTPAAGQGLPVPRIAEAAARGVAAIQRSQAVWYQERDCSSCHHQFQPAIAFALARAHGVAVDEAVATANAPSLVSSDVDAALRFDNVIEPALQEGYRLVAAHAAGVEPNFGTALMARFLIARQRPAGDWSGLNQRPPSSSSDFAKTAIGLRAVQLFHHRADTEAARQSVARAAAWLRSHQARDTEGRTYQLLGLHWTGSDAATRARLARALIATQRSDGGWGSIEGRASEAYSTGEALFALHEAGGVATSNVNWQRGIAFLTRTQAADGSWHVPSRLHDPARLSPAYFESGYPYGNDQFISVAGAAWAVMALARALPPVARPVEPTRPATRSTTIDPWVETVVFGTVDELRDLLDKGLSPNAATAGRTTVLMMAAGDPAKLRLLLDRGADVNARAASGFTALMVAAQYGGSVDTVGLLLDRGARVQATADGRPSPSYPLALAAHAGNASILERLHRAGDPVDGAFGLSATSAGRIKPMTMAVRNGDLEVVRTLLDLGVSVNGSAADPWSPLEMAVHNNNVALARLFIERGTDVNAIGKAGYTPLLLAASIDFGDTEMMELLLEAGARVDIRNPAGRTALDLARDYQHTRFVPILERRTGHRERPAHRASVAKRDPRL
ncbi:MAG: ankyrin repeat domain-containing protein [Luteibacter sp.]|jgi:ankyrin repeat protein